MKLTSTVALGDGAFGTVSFFTAPQGQRMHFLGNIPVGKVPELDETHTTLKQAGDQGSAIGAVRLKSIQAQTNYADLQVAGGFEIVVGGKVVGKDALLEIYKEPKPLGGLGRELVLQRTDAFEIRVTLPVDAPLKLTKKHEKDVPVLLLTLELDGDFTPDVVPA